jgi:hypothetical protein
MVGHPCRTARCHGQLVLLHLDGLAVVVFFDSGEWRQIRFVR